MELFAVPFSQRIFSLYHLVRMWWTSGVECVCVYPVRTPWLYIYFTRLTKEVGIAQQRTFHEIALHQFVTLSVPVLINPARWGTYIGNFRYDCLKKSLDDRSQGPWTFIDNISPIVGCVIIKEDPLGLCRMVESMVNGARKFLVMQTIFKVDWHGKCSGNLLMNTG